MVEDRPNWRTGKLCYIEIPAVDVAASAGFYRPLPPSPGSESTSWPPRWRLNEMEAEHA